MRKVPSQTPAEYPGMIRFGAFFVVACLAAVHPVSAAADPSFLRSSVPDSARQGSSGSSAAFAAYSPLHAVYGSVIGFGLGAVIGALAMKPATDACVDGVNSAYAGSYCGLNTLFGMAVGGASGYSLAVPVGGHFSQGLKTRKFAINMAAITVLSGVLVYANWRIFDAGQSLSLQYTIPLSMVAPHLAAYLIGR